MEKTRGIFLFLAAIPALAAAATPAFAKAAPLGAVGALRSQAISSIAQSYEPKKKGRGYTKKERKGYKTTRNPAFVVQWERLKNTRNGLLALMFNFDLIDAFKVLGIKQKSEACL